MAPRRREGPAAKPDLHQAAAAPAPAAEPTVPEDGGEDRLERFGVLGARLMAELHWAAFRRGDRP
jgi:hypothetical protein